jgi:hypothetical protein
VSVCPVVTYVVFVHMPYFAITLTSDRMFHLLFEFGGSLPWSKSIFISSCRYTHTHAHTLMHLDILPGALNVFDMAKNDTNWDMSIKTTLKANAKANKQLSKLPVIHIHNENTRQLLHLNHEDKYCKQLSYIALSYIASNS